MLLGGAPFSTFADRESGAALFEYAAASVQAHVGALVPLETDIPGRPSGSPFPAVRAAGGGDSKSPSFRFSPTVSVKRNPAADGEYAFARMLVRTLSPLCRIACG